MTDLADFLSARIAEDALAAEQAIELRRTEETLPGGVEVGPDTAVVGARPAPRVSFEPERVLAECEAKRRIATVAGRLMSGTAPNPPAPQTGLYLLKVLAAPYSGHNDYQADWAP